MPTPGFRSQLSALLLALACQTGIAATEVERGLALEPDLHSEFASSAGAEISVSARPPEALSLVLSRSLPSAAPEAPVTQQVTFPLPAHTLREWVNEGIKNLFYLLFGLTVIHAISDWLYVLRQRTRRPSPPIVMAHAPWPTISILLPPQGRSSRGSPGHPKVFLTPTGDGLSPTGQTGASLTRQIERIRSLPGLEFGYPSARIHFVIAFDAAELALADEVTELARHYPGRIHPLPMRAATETPLTTLLEAALSHSVGDALVLLDQELPLPADWLRAAITPLLDPATAIVVSRSVLIPSAMPLAARLDLLTDHAEAQFATQSDALALLVAGKARIRALRRQALKALPLEQNSRLNSGASIAIELTRRGWQSALLDSLSSPNTNIHAASQGFQSGHTVSCLRLITSLIKPRIPALARQQALRTSALAARTLVWQLNLVCALALYFTGSPLLSGIAVLIGVASAFDPHGIARTPIRIAAFARASNIREELRLLPLIPLLHLVRTIQGMKSVKRPVTGNTADNVFNETTQGCKPA
jgi:hypothetical protein